MNSPRPYLLRAINEWLVDNGLTPHLLVDAEHEAVQVPRQFVEEGAIVLNISPNAVRDLQLGDEYVMFSARFSGVAYDICVPIDAVHAIYARENGQGLALGDFGLEEAATTDANKESSEASKQKTDGASSAAPRAPHLTIVK